MTMTANGLAKLIEECGELIQIAGKKLAWYDTDEPHWDGTILNERLADEMGDVIAAIEFVSSMLGIHQEAMDRSLVKLRKLVDWHSDKTNNQHGIDADRSSFV